MTAGLAKLMMSLTHRCLGRNRHEWARAMEAEFEMAARDGRSLAFAFGCLVAACRVVPTHDEGRYGLLTYTLAIGLLVPSAAAQLGCATWFSYLSHTGDAFLIFPESGSAPNPYVAGAYLAAMPSLLELWLLLCALHLRLAWLLLESDWPRVIYAAFLAVAASATLVISTRVLLIDDVRAQLQAVVLVIELMAIGLLGYWNARIFPRAGLAPAA